MLPKQPTVKGPADLFTATSRARSLTHTGQHRPLQPRRPHRLARPRRRPDPYVTEGIGLIQSRGGEVIEIRPGDVIYTRQVSGTGTVPRPTTSYPHRHVGGPAPDSGPESEWNDLVADEDYNNH
jgi:hypothetical protein